MLDVVEDHFEVHVVEGDSRSAESSCERWCHVIVSPSRSARLRCWSQCSPHRLQGWICSRLMIQYHDVRENQIRALCVCAWFHGFPRSIVNIHDAIVFTLHRFPRSIWRTKFFLQTFTNNLLWMGRFSFLHKNTFRLRGFPRAITDWIGFGDWVGLEDSARGASPKDCWTSFPTGCCSTVEPDWSFPLVHLWSCFNEIFGGGRGDKYRPSYNISPVFNLSTFEIQWAGSVPWRIIAFDRVW